jgi:lipopolysaccharide transport system permease protein
VALSGGEGALRASGNGSPAPNHVMQHARPVLADAWREVNALARYRDLIRHLVSASLKTEHVGTVFGALWWIADPLLLMAIYTFVVAGLLGRGGPDYPLFVLCALVPWKWFSSSVTSAMSSTAGRVGVMKQVAFPRSVVPLTAVIGSTAHFGFGLLVLFAAAPFWGRWPDPVAISLPLVVGAQFCFCLGAAFFLSALNLFFRDIGNLVRYALRVGFYLSPGLYSLDIVPAEYRAWYMVNPFATLLPAYRAILLDHVMPDLAQMAAVIFAALLTLTLGFLFFVWIEPEIGKIA